MWSTAPTTASLAVRRWVEIKDHMASLGYASVLQEKAIQNGSHSALAIFYRVHKIRMVWQEERSRALLMGLELRQPDHGAAQQVWR